MAGVLTGIDKALLLRAARLLLDKAAGIEAQVGCLWSGRRKEKQAFDALHRDARDIRALVRRLNTADLASLGSGHASMVAAWPLLSVWVDERTVNATGDARALLEDLRHEMDGLVPESSRGG